MKGNIKEYKFLSIEKTLRVVNFQYKSNYEYFY